MKRFFLLLLIVPVFVFAESMHSPTWGFRLNLPEGYEFVEGDGRDRFSFSGPSGAMFDIIVYNGVYRTMRDLTADVNRRLSNRGDVDFFQYNDKEAALIKLNFGSYDGWGLCVELAPVSAGRSVPMLLALAYGPGNVDGLEYLHISALDSICPTLAELYYPGPITEYGYPRGDMVPVTLENGINAMIRENDAQAAQALIEREFLVLQIYANSQYWQEAWKRYYRLVYRDSWDRITFAASALVQSWGGYNAGTDEAKRAFAQRALVFVQNFNYERDFTGSDFVNLVTAITERTGDCDSRAMLWAIILAHADIRAAMMVSRQYTHAMGLADIPGTGARFDHLGIRWLVAETTASVDIGLIAQDQSDPAAWLGVAFE